MLLPFFSICSKCSMIRFLHEFFFFGACIAILTMLMNQLKLSTAPKQTIVVTPFTMYIGVPYEISCVMPFFMKSYKPYQYKATRVRKKVAAKHTFVRFISDVSPRPVFMRKKRKFNGIEDSSPKKSHEAVKGQMPKPTHVDTSVMNSMWCRTVSAPPSFFGP